MFRSYGQRFLTSTKQDQIHEESTALTFSTRSAAVPPKSVVKLVIIFCQHNNESSETQVSNKILPSRNPISQSINKQTKNRSRFVISKRRGITLPSHNSDLIATYGYYHTLVDKIF